MAEIVRLVPRERVDGLKVKPEGPPEREVQEFGQVDSVTSFLVSQNLACFWVSNNVVDGWDGWTVASS